MKIQNNSYVSIHYTLTSDDGQVIDSSLDRDPLNYIQGLHMIVPGLEKEMLDHQKDDKFNVKVSSAEGYGERNDELIQELELSLFNGVEKVEVGMSFYAQTPNGPMPLTVTQVTDTHAIVDANHPLAGQNLNFEIEVVAVREATEEEIQAQTQPHSHNSSCDSCCSDCDSKC